MENVAAALRIAFVAVLALAAAREAEACSCLASGPPCQDFFKVQGVFVGTVRSITRTADPQRPPSQQFRVEFEETIAFKGADSSTQSVLTATDGAACGFPFEIGERYVVYASRAKPGAPLEVYVCSRTRHVSDAADDLVFLKSLSNASPSPRVFGAITHTEFNLVKRELVNHGPVPNIQLTLRNGVTTYEATTNAQGRYEFVGITPARYDLAIQLPAEFASNEREKQTVDLSSSRSCAEANFVLRFDGRVQGLVRTNTGAPAADVSVQMMPLEFVETTGPVETIDATTDAAGRFEFGPVAPGRYVIGVELLRIPVDAALRSTIVEFRGGERLDLAPMTLPPARRPHRLTGTVTMQDGTPAVGVSVVLVDGRRTWLDVAEPVETDSAGTFSFVVHEGLSYNISAAYRGRNAQGRRRTPTNVGPFVVTKEPAPLRIVVPRP